jgi:hypothetical protein
MLRGLVCGSEAMLRAPTALMPKAEVLADILAAIKERRA